METETSQASPGSSASRVPPSGLRRTARWWRGLIVAIPVLVVGLLLLVVGARWWLDHVLHSEDFRRFLDQKLSAATKAQAHISPLRWEGSEVYSPGVTVRGSLGGPLAAVDADEVRATFDFNALWRRVWRVDTISVERIDAKIGNGPVVKPAPPPPRLDEVAAPGADRSFLASLLPNRMDIGEVRVAEMSLRWGSDQPAASGRIERVRVNARMLGNVYDWEVEGRGGTLTQSGLPPLGLDDLALKTTKDAIFITRATGRPEAGGTLEISGSQTLKGDKALELLLDFDGVPVEPFLPPDWRGRLHGRAHGHTRVTGSPDDAGSWHSAGQIELRAGEIEALPVLNELAIFADSARYRHATVQRGTADFDWTPDRLQVRNLALESEGLLRVEGGFTVHAQQIDGLFQVGVAVTSVRWVNEIGAAVFDLPQHDGYAWTTMHLTGPVSNPHEDLSGRMAASAEQALIHKAKQGSDAVLDTASGLLDLLKTH